MKNIYYFLLLLFLLPACGDLDEINTNPDTPTVVTTDFLATRVILKMNEPQGNKWYTSDTWLMKSTSFTEHLEWYMYNKFERSSFESFYHLIDAQKMVDLAESDETIPEEELDAYKGLYHFARAWFFYETTMAMGDIPCSEALKGETEGIFSPKYDTQEEVFGLIIRELEQAGTLFGQASQLKGDPVYNSDVSKWQKAVSGFALRVLNMLSNKSTVSGIDVKSTFEKFAAQPLFTHEGESFQRVYDASKSTQWFPFYYEIQNFWAYPVMTSFFIDMLKELDDYRLFYYANPAENLKSAGSDSFDAYSGVDPVLEYGQIQAEFNAGMHSPLNPRYHRVAQGEPTKFIAYSEVQFILAEAALRGWNTPASAKAHYENGVRAAMAFTADHTPADYRNGVTIDEEYISDYLQGKAAFTPATGLRQILVQKYIGAFLQIPFNSYYDYRRTGYPELPIDPATNMNEVKEQMPVRWMYPDTEYSQNKENIEEALKRQFGSTTDTPNDVMWLLK